MPDRLHTVPVDDLIKHDISEDCICGPMPDPVFREDGSNGWVFVHHPLDGRGTSDRQGFIEDAKKEIRHGEG